MTRTKAGEPPTSQRKARRPTESIQDMVCTAIPAPGTQHRSAITIFKPFRIDVKHKRSHRVSRGLVTAAILIIGGTQMTSPAESFSAGHHVAARVARSLNATTTAHLHLVKAEGSELLEEGPVSGALPGSMRADLKTGAVFTGSFTTHTHGGSIKGRGSAKPHGSGRYQSFSGSFTVTGGTGRYAHVNGRAGLYGVFDRRTDSAVVQTTGKLSY